MTEEKQVYDLKALFEAVQLKKVLQDGKTFADSIPKFSLAEIEKRYNNEKKFSGFRLDAFIKKNFNEPINLQTNFKSDTTKPVEEHIKKLWDVLTRTPNSGNAGSLLNLPYSYIVPGGRFREIYYWDSYFTMLGLWQHGRMNMIENMVENFAYLLRVYGHIPNGNRAYYLSRSQPPYFALMVELLATAKNDDSVYTKYLDVLQKEYDFWQLGAAGKGEANLHTVRLADGEILHRYFDESATARQESYAEDLKISKQSAQPAADLFTNIRAGAESGWDFSSRWFADQQNISTIETVNIIPVDLNCLMYKLEMVLSKAYAIAGDVEKSNAIKTSASKRWQTILQYCWNDELGFFTDYNWVNKSISNHISAAGLMPLFVAEADDHFIKQHLKEIVNLVNESLLQPGGIVTTPITSGQQWDAPNGWAPLQWIVVKGLEKFGEKELAKIIALRWTALNDKVFEATGKMMEKYDVKDIGKLAGGGEYESQDGFGWTNGVYLALKDFLVNNQ